MHIFRDLFLLRSSLSEAYLLSWTWSAEKNTLQVALRYYRLVLCTRGKGSRHTVVRSNSDWGGACQRTYLQIIIFDLGGDVWLEIADIGALEKG